SIIRAFGTDRAELRVVRHRRLRCGQRNGRMGHANAGRFDRLHRVAIADFGDDALRRCLGLFEALPANDIDPASILALAEMTAEKAWLAREAIGDVAILGGDMR